MKDIVRLHWAKAIKLTLVNLLIIIQVQVIIKYQALLISLAKTCLDTPKTDRILVSKIKTIKIYNQL
jgi:hypothetical protein